MTERDSKDALFEKMIQAHYDTYMPNVSLPTVEIKKKSNELRIKIIFAKKWK